MSKNRAANTLLNNNFHIRGYTSLKSNWWRCNQSTSNAMGTVSWSWHGPLNGGHKSADFWKWHYLQVSTIASSIFLLVFQISSICYSFCHIFFLQISKNNSSNRGIVHCYTWMIFRFSLWKISTKWKKAKQSGSTDVSEKILKALPAIAILWFLAVLHATIVHHVSLYKSITVNAWSLQDLVQLVDLVPLQSFLIDYKKGNSLIN